MPRKAANGHGTIRQRKDGTWEGRYTAGRDPGTGRQLQKSVYGKTEKEVAAELRRITSALDDNAYVEPSKMTLSAWLDIYLAEYTGGLKEHSLATYEMRCRTRIKPALGAVALSALKPHEIQTAYNRMKRDGLAAKTIKAIHGVLHRALDQAVSVGYLRVNPCQGVKLPRIEKPDIKPLMDDEVERFRDAIKGNEYEALFTVTMYTGMRLSEVMGLTWNCVDFKKGTIYVDKQLIHEKKKNGAYKFAPPKNDKKRRIAPGAAVMKMLEGVRLRQKEMRLRCGPDWNNSMNLVFTSETGLHRAHTTIERHFKEVVTNMGLADRRFHDLRHPYVKPPTEEILSCVNRKRPGSSAVYRLPV